MVIDKWLLRKAGNPILTCTIKNQTSTAYFSFFAGCFSTSFESAIIDILVMILLKAEIKAV